jgi:hypothetical protein
MCAQNSAVSVANHYGLDGAGIEFRWGLDFPQPPRPALGLCTVATGSFAGVKRPGRGVNHPPHLAPRLQTDLCYATPLLCLWQVIE